MKNNMDLGSDLIATWKLSGFPIDNRILIFKETIELEVKYNYDIWLYTIEYPRLGIDVCGSTIEELHNELFDHIEFLWRNYAMDDNDDGMTKDAKELKYRLIDVVSH